MRSLKSSILPTSLEYLLGMKVGPKPDRSTRNRKTRNPELKDYKNRELDRYTVTGSGSVLGIKLGIVGMEPEIANWNRIRILDLEITENP